MTMMKANVYHRYGGPEVVHLANVPKPIPGKKEILVKIYATTITSGDWRIRTLNVPTGFGIFARPMFGFRGPRQPILGSELAGVVEKVGEEVTRFKAGDEVFAFIGSKMGCHAQYQVIKEDEAIVPKPTNLSFEETAALSFGGTTVLHYLRKAKLKKGEKVLVIGASGNVGSMFIQIAKHFGAEVTAVTSTGNVELVTSLGADKVIDYTKEDFTQREETYDIIADTVRSTSFSKYKHVLKAGGRLLGIAAGLPDMLTMLWMNMKRSSKKVITGVAEERREDLEQLAELAKIGQLRPVIDHVYDFTEMVDAHTRVDTGRKRGSVVVRVTHDE